MTPAQVKEWTYVCDTADALARDDIGEWQQTATHILNIPVTDFQPFQWDARGDYIFHESVCDETDVKIVLAFTPWPLRAVAGHLYGGAWIRQRETQAPITFTSY